MRKEYYEIYGDLYDMYRRRWYDISRFIPERFMPEWYFDFGPMFESRVLRWITEAIEYAISDLGLTHRVRPDAKHFLLVNLHQLVVLPLIHPESKQIAIPELRDMLRNDVVQILKYSSESEESEYNNRHEISGSLVLKTISRIWKDLSLNKIEVWG